jgi:hypothetical protein
MMGSALTQLEDGSNGNGAGSDGEEDLPESEESLAATRVSDQRPLGDQPPNPRISQPPLAD